MNSDNRNIKPINSNSETILVADDDHTIRELCNTILENSGFKVIVAEDGKETIQLFDEFANDIDIVLIDVVMPKMNGREVYEHIHKEKPHTPIIFTSGYGESVITASFHDKHEIQFLNKPFHKDSLLYKIREVLGNKLEEIV